MLETSGQIAAGLGAQPRLAEAKSGKERKPNSKKGRTKGDNSDSDVPVGNAPLGLWIGEQFLGQSSFLISKM